jgi:hypothetical protein
MGWAVEFFANEEGNAPVAEFLRALPLHHRAKTLAIIKYILTHAEYDKEEWKHDC